MALRLTQQDYEMIAERLGYSFRDKALLRQALTHGSTLTKKGDYQRLEFLGDRVLGLIIAEELYRQNPTHREGHMANLHSNLVRGGVCGEVGKQLGLSEWIAVGQSERKKGINLNVSVLGDVVEALIGGIYLDGGLAASKTFILNNWATFLAERKSISKDPKTYLQEWSLAQGLAIPAYKVLKREGLEHSPLFTVELSIKGKPGAEGQGTSKQMAEMAAASKFLEREGIRK
jgi:ribonuclease III